MVAPGQGGGRPRDAQIDAAVLEAARALLAEVGYPRVTMETTAARAGTSKTAIYRRYTSKAELLFAATVHGPELEPPPDTGSLHGDLFQLGTRIRSDMAKPAAREVVPQVIAELARSPELSQRLRDVFVAAEREQITTILTRAVTREELPQMPSVATVHRLLGGALFFTIMVIEDTLDDPRLADTIEMLTAGIQAVARRSTPMPAPVTTTPRAPPAT